ncbi:hypothetical protein RJ639_024965 [Escallonia herrerae]|uniref:Uncharacterized protein n=1 Tax=Escallonia herrerae TaxID=1293975 RepID=A0AA88UVW3_9ASTE|nr:hypothetical protein RJ639_024965 [Escallonia herrerae]
MTTLQRSAYSFRRQGSSGRIWDTRLQLSEPKSGELHAAIPRGNNQEDRFYDEELVDSQSSAASPPSGKQEKIPHSRSGKKVQRPQLYTRGVSILFSRIEMLKFEVEMQGYSGI